MIFSFFHGRILPCLSKEFVNPTMVPFVLPNILLMAEKCSREEYCQKILPGLKPVMKIQEPIQVSFWCSTWLFFSGEPAEINIWKPLFVSRFF